MLDQAENRDFYKEITIEEVIESFNKDKSPGLEDWSLEFFRDFFEVVGNDLLLTLEERRKGGKLPPAINSTFLAMTPKTDLPATFEDLRSITLCNCLYKIHSKLIALQLKPLLSNYITREQFGFLKLQLIHEAIGFAAQEGLHTIKT